MRIDHSATASTMRERLKAAFTPLILEIEDQSARHAGHAGAANGGGHFSIRMISAAFEGLGPLQRQRLVYDELSDLMKHEIHALSMVLLVPAKDEG